MCKTSLTFHMVPWTRPKEIPSVDSEVITEHLWMWPKNNNRINHLTMFCVSSLFLLSCLSWNASGQYGRSPARKTEILSSTKMSAWAKFAYFLFYCETMHSFSIQTSIFIYSLISFYLIHINKALQSHMKKTIWVKDAKKIFTVNHNGRNTKVE